MLLRPITEAALLGLSHLWWPKSKPLGLKVVRERGHSARLEASLRVSQCEGWSLQGGGCSKALGQKRPFHLTQGQSASLVPQLDVEYFSGW